MIEELKMYTVLCDNCGADSCDGGEYSGYVDKSTALENAMNCDFMEHKGKHYCDNCWTYDDNDDIVIDQTRTKQL